MLGQVAVQLAVGFGQPADSENRLLTLMLLLQEIRVYEEPTLVSVVAHIELAASKAFLIGSKVMREVATASVQIVAHEGV